VGRYAGMQWPGRSGSRRGHRLCSSMHRHGKAASNISSSNGGSDYTSWHRRQRLHRAGERGRRTAAAAAAAAGADQHLAAVGRCIWKNGSRLML
jgi:hypothetical protein